MRTQRTVTENRRVEKRVILIEEFWNTLDPKPDMTFKEFELICKTPFQHVKKRMSDDSVYDVRFKYLGSFTPVPKNLVWLLGNMKERFRKGYITRELMETRTKALLKYIEMNPEPFKRFKELLRPWKSY